MSIVTKEIIQDLLIHILMLPRNQTSLNFICIFSELPRESNINFRNIFQNSVWGEVTF